jgi:hypothetical protein
MLLRAAVEVQPAGTTIDIGSIRGIPLYDADVEKAEGIPAVVQELKLRISAADGLLISTPEYNNSIPGVLKNAVDWLSRPGADIPRFGCRWRSWARHRRQRHHPGAGGGAGADARHGALVRRPSDRPAGGLRRRGAADQTVRTRLEAFVAGFAAFVTRRRRENGSIRFRFQTSDFRFSRVAPRPVTSGDDQVAADVHGRPARRESEHAENQPQAFNDAPTARRSTIGSEPPTPAVPMPPGSTWASRGPAGAVRSARGLREKASPPSNSAVPFWLAVDPTVNTTWKSVAAEPLRDLEESGSVAFDEAVENA